MKLAQPGGPLDSRVVPEYDVQTPLEHQWIESPEDVREVVARYMRTEGASLNRVSVVLMPGRPGVGMGQDLSPANFWDEP